MKKSKDYTVRILTVLLGVVILDLGVALSVRADIGMGTYDGMTATIADVFGIKIGTFSIILNYLVIIAQLAIDGKGFRKTELLQFPNVFFSGLLINLFTYRLFGNLTFDSYIAKLAASAFSNVLRAFGVMLILESDFIRTAMEGLVQVICDKRNRKLGRIMQLLDVVYIAVSLILTFIFHTPFRIREGTVIAMLMFGPLLELFKKPIEKIKGMFFPKAAAEVIQDKA